MVPRRMIETSCEMFAVLDKNTTVKSEQEWLASRRDGDSPRYFLRDVGTG